MFLQPSPLSCAEISFSVTAPRDMLCQHQGLSGKGKSGHGRLLSREILPRGLIVLKTHMIICASTVPCVPCDAAFLRTITGDVLPLTQNCQCSKKELRAQRVTTFFIKNTLAPNREALRIQPLWSTFTDLPGAPSTQVPIPHFLLGQNKPAWGHIGPSVQLCSPALIESSLKESSSLESQISFLPRGPDREHLNLSETFSPPKRSLWKLFTSHRNSSFYQAVLLTFQATKGPASACPRAMGARMAYKSMNKENHQCEQIKP